MAREVLNALFTAKENISGALEKISRASTELDARLRNLDREVQEMAGHGQISKEAMDELRDTFAEMSGVSESVERSLSDIDRTLEAYDADVISADEATDQLRESFSSLLLAAESADQSVDGLETQIGALREAGQITDQGMESFSRTLINLRNAFSLDTQGANKLARALTETNVGASRADDSVEELTTSLYAQTPAVMQQILAQEGLQSAVEDTSDEMEQIAATSVGAAGSLSTLNAVTSSTALSMSSLSVNVGPFNIALRNILTQLPMILTGMSTMLALVTSLATAFVTLGAVSGALVFGGALAFFEEFSQQFEKAGEATQALMSAMKDLFTEALEPIMTEANVDLFTSSVNSAAEVVNEFAQFVSQMRGDVMRFVDTLNVDLDAGLESMHDSFVMMQPVLRGFIEFFINDLPPIVTRFAALSQDIGDEIGALLMSFGALTHQLLDFVSVAVNGLAPIMIRLVKAITVGVAILNSLNDTFVSSMLYAAGLTVIVVKLISSVVGLAASIANLNAVMAAQVGTGSLLGVVYTELVAGARAYTGTSMTLAAAMKSVTLGIWGQVKAFAANTAAKIKNNLVTQSLITAMKGLVSWIKTSTAWMYIQEAASKALAVGKAILAGAIALLIPSMTAESAAASISAAAMSLYAVATEIAAVATWTLTSALGVLASLSLSTVAIIGALVAALFLIADFFMNGAIGDAIGGFFGGIISWIQDTIDAIMELLSLGPGKGGILSGVGGVADTDDIMTDPNVDLSFEDKVENNVDVQADPEDKAQLSRLTKDAIEEANSFSRRQQGGQ